MRFCSPHIIPKASPSLLLLCTFFELINAFMQFFSTLPANVSAQPGFGIQILALQLNVVSHPVHLEGNLSTLKGNGKIKVELDVKCLA